MPTRPSLPQGRACPGKGDPPRFQGSVELTLSIRVLPLGYRPHVPIGNYERDGRKTEGRFSKTVHISGG